MQPINKCLQNAQFWKFIRKLQLANPKITITPQQRFELCKYMNGQPFDRNILAPFIKPSTNTPSVTPSV
jgi:hypothetical protein